MTRSKLRVLFIRWHRRIGVVSVVLVIWVALSGFLLNHVSRFGLDETYLENKMILSLYGRDLPKDYIIGFYETDKGIIAKTLDGMTLYNKDGSVAQKLFILPETAEETKAPKTIIQTIERNYRGNGVPLDRVILDAHSGKLFGLPGTLLMDLTALAILFLGVTGIYQFIKRKKK